MARSKAELDLADLEIEHNNGASLRLRCDVRDYEQVTAAVDRMRVNYGAIHTIVCAAGISGPIGPFAECDPKQLADVAHTNLLGAMNVVRAVLPEMIRRRSGKIILLAGYGCDLPRPHFSPYAASKAALVRFGETLAEEVAEANIQVNCVNPGATYTAMTDDILRAANSQAKRNIGKQPKYAPRAAPRTTVSLPSASSSPPIAATTSPANFSTSTTTGKGSTTPASRLSRSRSAAS